MEIVPFIIPVLGLILGFSMAAALVYVDTVKSKRKKVVKWIRKTVYQDAYGTEIAALSLFRSVAIIGLVVGILVMVASSLFIQVIFKG